MVRNQTSKEQKKHFVKAVLEVGPVRSLFDLCKARPSYRRLLNASLPGWLKYRGVYHSFPEALAAVPENVRPGYDHEELGHLYDGYLHGPLESDYPIMFWLREVIESGSRVFDFGGNTGFSFYAWGHKHLRYDGLSEWMVCDLPSIVKAGRELAKERDENRLRFSSKFEDCDGFDILLTSGCLQYVEAPFRELLTSLKDLPKHLIVNRVPLNLKGKCVTLQNIGRLAAPYHVFQRDEFISEIESLGYQLIDEWNNSDHSCWIPLYPEYSVSAYTGLYFRLEVTNV